MNAIEIGPTSQRIGRVLVGRVLVPRERAHPACDETRGAELALVAVAAASPRA